MKCILPQIPQSRLPASLTVILSDFHTVVNLQKYRITNCTIVITSNIGEK